VFNIPRGTATSHEYPVDFTPADRMRVRYSHVRGTLIDIMVNLECEIAGRWVSVRRYDCHMGYHVHTAPWDESLDRRVVVTTERCLAAALNDPRRRSWEDAMDRKEQADKNLELARTFLVGLLDTSEQKWPPDGAPVVFMPEADQELSGANRAILERMALENPDEPVTIVDVGSDGSSRTRSTLARLAVEDEGRAERAAG
jgi:hypothetical protein